MCVLALLSSDVDMLTTPAGCLRVLIEGWHHMNSTALLGVLEFLEFVSRVDVLSEYLLDLNKGCLV